MNRSTGDKQFGPEAQWMNNIDKNKRDQQKLVEKGHTGSTTGRRAKGNELNSLHYFFYKNTHFHSNKGLVSE